MLVLERTGFPRVESLAPFLDSGHLWSDDLLLFDGLAVLGLLRRNRFHRAAGFVETHFGRDGFVYVDSVVRSSGLVRHSGC